MFNILMIIFIFATFFIFEVILKGGFLTNTYLEEVKFDILIEFKRV